MVAELLGRHDNDWNALFRSLQSHATDAAQGEVDLLQRDEDRREDATGHSLPQRGDHVLQKLERLRPGAKLVVSLLKDGEDILTTPEEVDAALRVYWERVFGPCRMDDAGRARLQSWLDALREAGGALPQGCPEWEDACVEQAVKAAGSSAPGVDGIPYEAYKRTPASVPVLQAAARALYDGVEDHRLPGDFNHSIMIFLPKKASGSLPNL
eukprot:6715468-Alexandrium_andersonii.AAC.1